MKRAFICILCFILLLQVVSAAEVCVVVDYGKDSELEPDSRCVDIDEGEDGYALMQETVWDLLWSPETAYGHMLCKINDVGTEVSGQYCSYSGEFWNIVLNRNGKWLHLPVGLDGPGGCWNYDVNSWNGHYCTKEGDVLGFAFGKEGYEPEMFEINISKVYVDGEKETRITSNGGKLREVPPGAKVEFNIELENLYDTSTDIDITDISIEGVIEEIDNGDDIEEDITSFDLTADRKTTEKLELTIPIEVEEKDRLVTITIKAEDSAGIKYEKEFTYDLEIQKEKHKLEITKADLNKDSYKCGENTLLDLSIINIGSNNENVNLRIENEELETDIREDFKLSDEAYDPSSKYENKFNIWLPDALVKKTYPITITANYGSEKEVKTINLVVGECEKEKTIEETTEKKTEEPKIEQQIEPEKEEKTAETTTKELTKEKNLPLVLTTILVFLFILIVIMSIIVVIRRK